MDAVDRARLALLRALDARGHRFVTITPASHARVLRRPERQVARDLAGVFGWSLPFAPDLLDAELLNLLRGAEALDETPHGLKSRLRASTLHGRLFLHSAYPTEAEDAVFLGPDSYRFADFVRAELSDARSVTDIVDIGAGAGVGGLVAAHAKPGARVRLTDVNPKALRLAAVNAAHCGIAVEPVETSGLDGVEAGFDLALANPPYVVDDAGRAYRDGGDMHGAALSLEWALAGAEKLAAGGRLLLYTGSAIVDGEDRLRAALEAELPARGCTMRWRELDPDVFGEELSKPAYAEVDRIAAIGAVITRR